MYTNLYTGAGTRNGGGGGLGEEGDGEEGGWVGGELIDFESQFPSLVNGAIAPPIAPPSNYVGGVGGGAGRGGGGGAGGVTRERSLASRLFDATIVNSHQTSVEILKSHLATQCTIPIDYRADF